MIDRVKRLWQASQPSDQLCPGEESCEDFKHAWFEGCAYEDQLCACATCPKKETKLVANRRDLLERFAQRVQQIARYRDSGYPFGPDEITAIELCGLTIWDEEQDFFDRSIRMVGLKFN